MRQNTTNGASMPWALPTLIPDPGFVREAIKSDVKHVAAMRVAFIQQVKSLTASERAELLDTQMHMFREGMERGSILIWVYQIGGEIVGSTGLLFRESAKAPTQAELMAVYTRRAYRHRGIATALVSAALAHARGLGLDAVMLQPTSESFDLYRKLGFSGNCSEMILQLKL